MSQLINVWGKHVIVWRLLHCVQIGLRFAAVCAGVMLHKCAAGTGKELVLWMRRERGDMLLDTLCKHLVQEQVYKDGNFTTIDW